jgi:Cupin domain
LTVPYFDRSGEASDEAGRWANFSHLPALHLVPGIAFQPITTDSVMTNFVTFEPNAVADMHHHSEQQIAIIISGELTFTVGDETRVTHSRPPPCHAVVTLLGASNRDSCVYLGRRERRAPCRDECRWARAAALSECRWCTECR